MLDPFEIGGYRAEVIRLMREKNTMDPAGDWKTSQWMDTPNPLLCGVTPNVYIDSGHGDKLITMLKEKL